MFPIRDNIPASTRPVMNYTIIAVTVLVFFVQLAMGGGGEALVDQFGMIPDRVTHPHERLVISEPYIESTPMGPVLRENKHVIEPTAFPAILTLLTCIFLHGGWLHIIGNMWFLYIFGDNVEDRLGHAGYLIFYLLCGSAASLAQLLVSPQSILPTIGASGAIAGVMGAYFLLYPHARVLAFIPIFILFYLFPIPAPIFIGIWFAIQFIEGTMSIGAIADGGVAWWAHVGGFIVGYLIVRMLRGKGWLRPAMGHVIPMIRRRGIYQRWG